MPDLNQLGTNVATLTTTLTDLAVRYGLQVLGALIIVLIGLRLARWAGNALDVWLAKKALDVSLRHLVVRIFRIIIVAATVIVAAEKAGVPVTSLVAGIGVAGVGAGLALQGVLGNVFAGLTILFTRPFKVGEYIEILTVHGQVTGITLFSTTLLHPDQSRVIVPNRKIVGEVLHNYGTMRQLELTIGIPYTADLDAALGLARETLGADRRVLAEPAAIVGVRDLNDSGMVLSIKPWVGVADYPLARVELFRALVEAFRAHGLASPSPQRDVRLLGQGAVPS
jgi:small conductance mechanosensitive channel